MLLIYCLKHQAIHSRKNTVQFLLKKYILFIWGNMKPNLSNLEFDFYAERFKVVILELRIYYERKIGNDPKPIFQTQTVILEA